jgi:heme exporter protein B
MIGGLILRDLRRGLTGAAWLPIAFFLLVATLVPFAIGPDANLLGRIGAGVLWIAALTAALLPIERLIESDRVDGVLDQLLLHGVADETTAVAKIAAHWLSFGPLLFVAAFPAAALLGIDAAALKRLLLSIWIGTPGLAALAVAVASLTAGLPRASSIAGLLLLPIAVPLLIFAAAFCGDGSNQAMALEAAISILLLAGSPFVTAAAIRAART